MNIRQWFRFYGERITFGQQPVAQISEELFFSVPWEHHLYIIAQCKDIDKAINNVMAQYALEATNQPIGISEYQLSKLMPEKMKSQLPTIEDIESTLSDNEF